MGELNAGKYRVAFDGRNLSGGVYVYVLETVVGGAASLGAWRGAFAGVYWLG